MSHPFDEEYRAAVIKTTLKLVWREWLAVADMVSTGSRTTDAIAEILRDVEVEMLNEMKKRPPFPPSVVNS